MGEFTARHGGLGGAVREGALNRVYLPRFACARGPVPNLARADQGDGPCETPGCAGLFDEFLRCLAEECLDVGTVQDC
jgi:hypothetical protein